MRSEKHSDARVYHTGSPRDYLLGVALLGVAAWFVYEFINAEKFHVIDRPIMATIAGLTFGTMGVFVILRGGVRALILDPARLCIRDWSGRSRCFALDRLTRVTWSYRYAGGLWARYDQGRAWLEFEFAREGGGHTVAVVDYAGRSRHRAIERFTRRLADRTALRWDPGSDPVEAADLPGAEIVWKRRRGGGDVGV